MAKSKKGKKKTKKNSNYKNEVIEKNVPKKSEKNRKELEHKAKIKEKQKKKEEKLSKGKPKKEEKSSSKDVKNKVQKSEEEKQEVSNEICEEALIPKEEISEELSPKTDTEEKESEEISEQKSNIILENVTNNDVEPKLRKEKKNIFSKFNFKKIKLTKKNVIIALVAIVTLAALISVLSVIQIGKTDYSPAIYSGKSFEDSEVGVISISDEKQSELIKKTDASGNTSKFSFYANTVMTVTSPDSSLPITIANPTTSDKIILCTIVNDDGVIVYRSLGILPGRFLNKVKLSQYLDYGKNELTLYVSAFKTSEAGSELTYKKVGTQKAKLEVNVGTDYASE